MVFYIGPFIPIYGVGAVLIITCLSPFISNIFLLFILGFIFMTIMEYIVGVYMEKMFNARWWDYSANFLNINGKVCLENSIYWGVLTVFLIKVLHPSIQMWNDKIPLDVGYFLITIFTIYFLIDYVITLVEVLNLQERIKKIVVAIDKSKIKSTIELREDFNVLKEKILKRSKRLLKIYPKLTYLKMNRKLRDIVSEIKEKN